MSTRLFSFRLLRFLRRPQALFLLVVLSLSSMCFFSVKSSSLTGRSIEGLPRADKQETSKKGRKRKCPACSQAGTQEIYIPLIELPEAQAGEIVFNSRSPQAVDVTPIFYRLNGTVVQGDPVRIESTEIRYVNVRELLPSRYRHERNWGGLSLTYTGFNREMWSQFRFMGVNGGGSVDEFFTVKEESRSDLLEAAWWMPEMAKLLLCSEM